MNDKLKLNEIFLNKKFKTMTDTIVDESAKKFDDVCINQTILDIVKMWTLKPGKVSFTKEYVGMEDKLNEFMYSSLFNLKSSFVDDYEVDYIFCYYFLHANLNKFYEFVYDYVKIHKEPHFYIFSCSEFKEYIKNEYDGMLSSLGSKGNEDFYNEFTKCYYVYLGKKAEEEIEKSDIMVKPACNL